LVGSSITSRLDGLREQARQQQAVAFAAGQRGDRRARAFRGEQEILQVAECMLAREAASVISMNSRPSATLSSAFQSSRKVARYWSK
jgi:hypothetical protein